MTRAYYVYVRQYIDSQKQGKAFQNLDDAKLHAALYVNENWFSVRVVSAPDNHIAYDLLLGTDEIGLGKYCKRTAGSPLSSDVLESRSRISTLASRS